MPSKAAAQKPAAPVGTADELAFIVRFDKGM